MLHPNCSNLGWRTRRQTTHAHHGMSTLARASCSGPIPAVSSPRPVTHTLTDDLRLLQATSPCFSLSSLSPTMSYQHPYKHPATLCRAEKHCGMLRSGTATTAHCRGIPEHPSPSLQGYRASRKAAAKRGEDCTSPNLPEELLLLGELFTSLGSLALQGRVHPRWECFAGSGL